jgi:hypothetical protein
MLRRCSCTAFAVMLVGLPTAQAADSTLTLACQGTVTDITQPVDGKPEPFSMGIIINFTALTITSGSKEALLGWNFPLKITSFDEATVLFEGSYDTELTVRTISGSIDRVTGDVKAVSTKTDKNTFASLLDVVYSLKCRPTQRMF